MSKPRTQDELWNTLIERSLYNEETGCFLWQGPIAGRGYGVTSWNSKQVYIHRLVYSFHYPNEEIKVVRHTCDTPNCWNIAHLRNGTTADNVADKINKGRHLFGSLIHNAAITEDDVREIRASQLNLYQLADKYKIAPSTVHYIKARKTWRHVP